MLLALILGGRLAVAQGLPCSRPEIGRTAAQVDLARKALLSLPVGDGLQTDVSPEAQQRISSMKRRLGDFAGAYMRCLSADSDPKKIERDLSALTHAFNLGSRIYGPDELPKEAGNYGFQLRFDVKTRAAEPRVVGVAADFQIECGWDAMLLVFARERGSWKEVFRWQSKPYAAVDGAFGAFGYAISPPDETGKWFVATKHIPPWCTSNWSAIVYSVLHPALDSIEPSELFSGSDSIYRGSGDDGRLTVGPKDFDLRFHSTSIDPAIHNRV